MKLLYNLLIIILLASTCLLISCSASSAQEALDRAESIMESNPDSALSIISDIDTDALTGKRIKARHSLLKSMALDKNYIDTTTFDVLQPAIDYYLQKGNADEIVRQPHDFIMGLPLRYNTKIGNDGTGLSKGQKQRILIARAVYKNPDFIFLDEATNSLDTKNERAIVENLDKFYNGRTVIVVAHRLSTVRNADQIIVLEGGRIVETGTHATLTEKMGTYYNLVKNQLELGN